MTVLPLPIGNAQLDVPARTGAAGAPFGGAFASALEAAGASLDRADAAERAFAAGRGGLHEMVLERAQADVVMAIASAAAARTAQSLTTILGMQI